MLGLMSLSNNNTKRIEQIDFIRGFAMMLVIFHHCIGTSSIGKIILAFHMPLFFIMSGYTFGMKDRTKKPTIEFFKSNLKRLIGSYLFFEFILLILSLIFSCFTNNIHVDILEAIKSIFLVLNNDSYVGLVQRLWFLPCIFTSNIITFLIVKQGGKIFAFVISLLLFFVSFLFSQYVDFRLPFTLDISILALSFMLLGYSFTNFINHLIYEKDYFVYLLLVPFLYFTHQNQPFYMYINEYGNLIYGMIGAITGSIVAISMISLIYKILKKWNGRVIVDYVIWIGLNTILIFPAHLFLLKIASYFVNNPAVKFIACSILLVPIINLLNRTFVKKIVS